MSNSSITLIKFDIKSGINEYCNYRLLAEDGIIIEMSGHVGLEYSYQAYDGGATMFDKLVKSKIDEGYKELKIEAMKEIYIQSNYQYNTGQTSGLILIECNTAQQLIQSIANNNKKVAGNNIKLNYNEDYYPITNTYKTTLGLIKKSEINKALGILKIIEQLLKKCLKSNQKRLILKSILIDKQIKTGIDGALKTKSKGVNIDINQAATQLYKLTNDYFSLIPTSLQSEEIVDMLLDNRMFYLVQKEICNLMLTYYEEVEMLKSLRMLNISDNDIKIVKVAEDNDLNRISDLYSSKNGNYPNTRVKNVFSVQFGEHSKRFIKKSSIVGNVQCVWHGTNKTNIASILTRGLLLPGNLTGNRNGGTYGSGIYFSSASSKSLGYCKNWNNSVSMKNNTTCLILASVAAGNYASSGQFGCPPKGYDSIWANNYTGSYSDELVVYSEDQVRIDYIVEVETK